MKPAFGLAKTQSSSKPRKVREENPMTTINRLSRIALTALISLELISCFLRTQAQDSRSGQWIIDTTRGSNQYQLTLNYPSTKRGFGNNINSFSLSPDRLQGLTSAQIMSSGSPVRFQIVRDAGTFNCEGWFKDGKGSGSFVLTTNPAFAAELQKRGLAAPTDDQLLSLAMNDVSIAFVEELNLQGFERPTTEQLVRWERTASCQEIGGKFKPLGTTFSRSI